jgi:hypothetical protein
MRQSKPAQDSASRGGQADQDFALVFHTCDPLNRAGPGQAVHQFHGAVMLDEKPGCYFANRWLNAIGQALHRQQQLMLLLLNAVFPGGYFTKMNEFPDLPPKLGEVAVLVRHTYIV